MLYLLRCLLKKLSLKRIMIQNLSTGRPGVLFMFRKKLLCWGSLVLCLSAADQPPLNIRWLIGYYYFHITFIQCFSGWLCWNTQQWRHNLSTTFLFRSPVVSGCFTDACVLLSWQYHFS
ncbi:hypothetical protein ASPCADRAFT_204537 [Aspergillus carbonarius ITEM 5010]|uniref:Uncharacterized protein n=1 Tax=Aspergillus carbonarius (strain ITEM 5010) TaxID=602072 RepID=A0A1R3RWG6_ASPC5|nr:hypothetical protein ASPCADRAFT_204537 [Aspergillus carbonarius ITEM 5010]